MYNNDQPYGYQPHRMGGYGQMQPMYQQPYQMQQNTQAGSQAQQDMQLFCRPVASIDEARAVPVDFTGKPMFFPHLNAGRIYMKVFDSGNGSAIFREFRMIDPEPEPSAQPAVAFAPLSEVDQRVMIDLTDVLIALLLLVIAIIVAFLTFLWKKWLRPWLERAGLTDLFDEFIGAFYEFGVKNIADIVVKAVEASFGRGNGKQKWQEALNKIQKWGFSVDDERVIDALKAAWLKLDLKQYEAGVKTKPPEQPETTEETNEEEQEEADPLEDTDGPVDDLVPLISQVGYK